MNGPAALFRWVRPEAPSDLPNVVRAAHGPGVGACRRRWPGHGSDHRPRHRPCLARCRMAFGSHCAGSTSTRDLDGALTRYEKQRNRDTKPAFEWTVDLARLRGASEIEERLFTTIGKDETEAAELLRHAHGRGADAVVLQPSAPGSADWSEGLPPACALSFALSLPTAARDRDLCGDRSGTGSEGAEPPRWR